MSIRPTLDSWISSQTGKRFECYNDFDTYEYRSGIAVEQFCQDVGVKYYGTPYNAKILFGWLDAAEVPVTRFNLGVAFQELSREGKFQLRPAQEVPELDLSTLSAKQLKALPRAPVTLHDVATQMHSKSTVKLNYKLPDTEMNRQLLHAEFLNRQEMCRIGADPRKTELGHQHKLSLRREQEANAQPALDDIRRAARHKVAMEHGRIKRDSPEFNRLVAEELATQVQ